MPGRLQFLSSLQSAQPGLGHRLQTQQINACEIVPVRDGFCMQNKIQSVFNKSLKNKIIKICSPGGRQNVKAKCALPCFAIFKNHILKKPELPESHCLFLALCTH